MSRLERLLRATDLRLRRIEQEMAATDAWLTRLMAPGRGNKGSAGSALANLLRCWRTGRG